MSSEDLSDKDVKGCLTTVLLFPFTVAYMTFADGYVLSRLWAWHAVPMGFAPLHWHTCAVVMLAYIVFRNGARPPSSDEPPAAKVFSWFVLTMLTPWMALLLGWWWS